MQLKLRFFLHIIARGLREKEQSHTTANDVKLLQRHNRRMEKKLKYFVLK